MTIRIGLVGAPSAGKSSAAADVFVHCKRSGVTVELVSEVAREEINKGWKIKSIAEQVIINQKQREREDIIPDEIDVMITDSPAFLTYYYALWNTTSASEENMIMPWLYSEFLKDITRYDKIYYLNRVKPYVKDGTRVQSEEESDQIGTHLKTLLEMHHVEFEEIDGDTTAVEKIMEYINYCVSLCRLESTVGSSTWVNVSSSDYKSYKDVSTTPLITTFDGTKICTNITTRDTSCSRT